MSPIASTLTAGAIGLAVAGALVTLVWLGSLVRRDASLVDRFWGAGFVVLAGWYWWSAPVPADPGVARYRALLLILVAIWGLRLSAYLSWRNWGHGEDYRYQAMRARGGPAFPWVNLVTIHWLQGAIMWVVALPLLLAFRGNGSLAAPVVWLGGAIWALGFYFEARGDWELARFRADPANAGRVLDTGVWRYTRHPNYFGDAAVWWGIYLVAVGGGAAVMVLSPILMTLLLLKVSGVAMLETKLVETKPRYRDYVRRTSAFLPRPPKP